MGAPEEVSMGAPEEVSMEAPEEASPAEHSLRNALFAASLGAGAIHIWAAWAHSAQTSQLVFFVAVATFQLWWAAVVLWVRDAPWWVLIGGAVANAGVVAVWVLSRTTTGIPWISKVPSMDNILAQAGSGSPSHPITKGVLQPHLSFGVPDTTASLLQIGVIVGAILLVRMRRRSAVLPDDSP